MSDTHYPRSAHPLPRLQGDQSVAIAHLDDAVEILAFGELLGEQPRPQRSQLVAIEVADELVHKLRARVFRGTNTVTRQLFENVGPVAKRPALSHPARPSRRRVWSRCE